jgi:spore coat protein D
MYCGPSKVLPATVCPPKCCVNQSFENIIVPVVHPSHTTNVHHTNYQVQHHFPHTQSNVNEVTSNDIGPVPGPPPRPTGVGPMGPMPGAYPGSMGPMGPMGPMPGAYPGSMGPMGPMPGAYPGSAVGGVSGFGPGLKGRPGYGR